MWPSYVPNGKYDDCENENGETKCDLKCRPGYIPSGNGKWICEDEKIANPVHSCTRAIVPAILKSCQTPRVQHGAYDCAWTNSCKNSKTQG